MSRKLMSSGISKAISASIADAPQKITESSDPHSPLMRAYVTLGDLLPVSVIKNEEPGFFVAGQGEALFVGLWGSAPSGLDRMMRAHADYLPSGAYQRMTISGHVLANLVSTVASLPRAELLDVTQPMKSTTLAESSIAPESQTDPLADTSPAKVQVWPAMTRGLSPKLELGQFSFAGDAESIHKSPSSDTRQLEAGAETLDTKPGNGDPKPIPLSEQLLEALEYSETDFRTVGSLAKEFAVSRRQIVVALSELGSQVRRPIGQEARYPDWYRLTARGMTRQEKRARRKAIVTFSSMDDDF